MHRTQKNGQWAEFGLEPQFADLCHRTLTLCPIQNLKTKKNGRELYVAFNKLLQMCLKVYVICLKSGAKFFSSFKKYRLLYHWEKSIKTIASDWFLHKESMTNTLSKECLVMQGYDVSFMCNQLSCQSNDAIDGCDIMSGHNHSLTDRLEYGI